MDEDDVDAQEYLLEEDFALPSTPQDRERKPHIWDKEMTFSLIDEYRNHLQDFLYPQGHIREIWENISHNMQSKGYYLSATAVDQKWRQLKKTFHHNVTVGRKVKTKWVYYDALVDILGNQDIAKRISWKQRSTIKRDKEEPKSLSNYTEEERLEEEGLEEDVLDEERLEAEFVQDTVPRKRAKTEEPPKWFQHFLTKYQEEEKEKQKMLQKMHTDLVALERQKCSLLENLIKKIPKTGTTPKIVDAVTLSQEVFEDEL